MADSLYSIHAEYRSLLDRFESDDQADLAALAAEFAALEGRLEEKLERCIAWARSQEALAVASRVEAKRLQGVAARREAAVERLKAYVLDIMRAQEIKKVDTPLGAVRRVKNGGRVPVIIEDGAVDALPPECVKTVRTPISDEIRERLERGEQLPKCRLGERGERVELG